MKLSGYIFCFSLVLGFLEASYAAEESDFVNMFEQNIEQKRDYADKMKLDKRRSALRDALRNDQAQSLRQRSIDNNSRLIDGLTEEELAAKREIARQHRDEATATADMSKLSSWINDNTRIKKKEKYGKKEDKAAEADNSSPTVSREEEELIDLLSD